MRCAPSPARSISSPTTLRARSGSQPHVPGNADLAPQSGMGAAHDERGRRVRPLRAGIRPCRGADAVQHVPPLYGGRASDPRRGQCRLHRARRASRRTIRFPPTSSSASNRARCFIARSCCTTSPRACPAIIPMSAPRSPQSLCPRLGLSPADTAAVAWLVQEPSGDERHRAARDISDPKTVRDFVAPVQTPEMLRIAAGADGGRHSRRRARRVERLEGPVAARTLLRSRSDDDAAATRRPRARARVDDAKDALAARIWPIRAGERERARCDAALRRLLAGLRHRRA